MVKMKRIIAVWLVILMLMGGMIGIVNLSTNADVNIGDAEIRSASQSKSGLTAHDPIYIDGNENFTAENGVSNPGAAGTESDPYIIENWDINASSVHGIRIENTTLYFVIRNCTLYSGREIYMSGIYIRNVSSGKIENVIGYNNYACLSLRSASNIDVANCSIYNNHFGAVLKDATDSQIAKCLIYNNSVHGIMLQGGMNNTLLNCSLYNNSGTGIHLTDHSKNNLIISCMLRNNGNGITLESAPDNTLRYNVMENCTGYLQILSTNMYDYNQTIEQNNIINNKPIYYIAEQNNLQIDESAIIGHLILISCNNISVKNQNMYGIELVNTTESTIANCTFHNNAIGLLLLSSKYNLILNCTFYLNGNGIWLNYAEHNKINNSKIICNWDYGIFVWESSENIITFCDINSTYLYKGIYVFSNSNNNHIFHNNIINNPIQAVDECSNSWDNGYQSGGNYWSDYTGTDTDADGIGDTPYYIPGDNNQDNYPLMNPVSAHVNQPPVASFTYSQTLATTTDTIYFTDQSYDPDGTIVYWYWNFGDYTTSTLQNPAHQYSVAGDYTVTLTVTDDDGAANTTSKEITILNVGININISLTNFTIANLTHLNISYVANITNLNIISISYVNISNLMNISNVSFANVFEVTLTNFTYMSSSSFINVSYINITQSMNINNLMFNNVSYVYIQNVTNASFVITAIPNITIIAYEDIQMAIPAEALILSMPFNLSTTLASLPPGYDIVGDIYKIECGVSVGAPINITLSYAGIVLPPGISEDDLAIYKKVGDNWIKIDSVIDKLNDTVLAQVTSFSYYAILYKQPSIEEEEAKPPEIPWLYIIIPVIVIVVLAAAAMGIKRRKRKVAPPPQPPAQQLL